MVRNTFGLNNADLIETLGGRRDISKSQQVILSAEVYNDPAGRGYNPKDHVSTANLLNSGYSGPNPTPRPTVLRKSIPQEEFRKIASNAATMWIKLGNTQKGALRDHFTAVLPYLVSLKEVDPNSADVSALFDAFVQEGVYSRDEVDGFSSELDPNYQDTIDNPSRASELFGPFAFIEVADLVTAGIA